MQEAQSGPGKAHYPDDLRYRSGPGIPRPRGSMCCRIFMLICISDFPHLTPDWPGRPGPYNWHVQHISKPKTFQLQ